MGQVVTIGLDIGKSVFPIKIAAIALANKTARIVWALMTSGERYRDPGTKQLATA